MTKRITTASCLNGSSIKDYIALMKPRVMSLVVFTALVGLACAPGPLHPVIAVTAIICIALGAGSAAAVNMWYDRDIDAVMARTSMRPLVTGKVEPEEALAFGIILGSFATLIMALCVSFFAAGLLIFTILYYVFVYTIWLKRRSAQNVVIGGLAGALPPMVGWAAVTGEVEIGSVILSAIIFMWTPPHSWALVLYRIDDYKNCNVPMMPIAKGIYYTKVQILLYSVLMFFVSLMPYFIGMAGIIYLIVALSMGIIFLYYSFALFNTENNQKLAKTFFIYSILYLFTIFLTILV